MSGVKQKMGSTKKFIVGLIVVLAVTSAAFFYLARTQFSEPYLTTGTATQYDAKPHDLIAFDQQGSLLGVSLKQGRFLLDRYHLDAPPEHAEVAAGTDPVQWTIGPDGVTLAWLSGPNRISVQKANFPGHGSRAWAVPKTVTAASDLVTFGVLQDGTIGFVLANGNLVQIDPAGAKSDVSNLVLEAHVSWARIRGDYAAVVTGDKLRLYRFMKEGWKMVEERLDFKEGSDRRLPADGQIVALVPAGVSMGDQTLNSPGKVTDVAMTDQGFLIVSGEFKGVYALPVGTREPYKLTDSPERVQLAAGRSALAYTSETVTVMLPFIENSRLNATGRLIVAIATALIALAILAALLLLYVDGKGLEPKSKRQHAELKELKLPKPPPDLVNALSSGEATLWAGAGLSATSGFPLRTAFISSVFQTAVVENWQSPKQMEPYWKLVTGGKTEEALDQFVASSPANRIRVADVARSTYKRFAMPNPTQRQLAKLPFNTAITSNYDTLLEHSGSEWARNTALVDGGAPVLALGSHVTVKLFGDFEGGARAILGRKDFKASLAANPNFAASFADLFEARPILFVGASLEGLLEDLDALKAPRPSGIKHYCVAGVASMNWKPRASDLKSKYNIEVFPCDVMNIQEQLKVFLAELQEAVEAEVGDTSTPQMGQSVG